MQRLALAFVSVILIQALSPSAAFSAAPGPHELSLFKVAGDGREETDALIVVDDLGHARALRVYDDVYTAEQMKEGANILIEGIAPENRALVIRGDVKPDTGGTLELDYLVSAVYGTRAQISVELRRDADGSWRVYLPRGKVAVAQMFMKAKWALGVQVGIAQIDVTLAGEPHSQLEVPAADPAVRSPASVNSEQPDPKKVTDAPAPNADTEGAPKAVTAIEVKAAG